MQKKKKTENGKHIKHHQPCAKQTFSAIHPWECFEREFLPRKPGQGGRGAGRWHSANLVIHEIIEISERLIFLIGASRWRFHGGPFPGAAKCQRQRGFCSFGCGNGISPILTNPPISIVICRVRWSTTKSRGRARTPCSPSPNRKKSAMASTHSSTIIWTRSKPVYSIVSLIGFKVFCVGSSSYVWVDDIKPPQSSFISRGTVNDIEMSRILKSSCWSHTWELSFNEYISRVNIIAQKLIPAGSLAPPEARLHGTENLLHRACTEGNIVVVTELLSMGYRYC